MQGVQISFIHLQAVIDMVRNTSFFAGRGLHHRVGGDAGDEMGAEVRREIGEALVAESLDGSHDGGGVYVIVFG